MTALTVLMFTPAAISRDAVVWRHSCSAIGSSTSFRALIHTVCGSPRSAFGTCLQPHASSARRRTVDGTNASDAVRPNTSASPSLPVASLCATSRFAELRHDRHGALACGRLGLDGRARLAPSAVVPRPLDADRAASRSTSDQRSARSSPRRRPVYRAVAHSAWSRPGSASTSASASVGSATRSRRSSPEGSASPAVGSTATSSRWSARR